MFQNLKRLYICNIRKAREMLLKSPNSVSFSSSSSYFSFVSNMLKYVNIPCWSEPPILFLWWNQCSSSKQNTHSKRILTACIHWMITQTDRCPVLSRKIYFITWMILHCSIIVITEQDTDKKEVLYWHLKWQMVPENYILSVNYSRHCITRQFPSTSFI